MTPQSPLTIPTIDISIFTHPDPDQSRLTQEIAAISTACRTHGFFLITGHGVPRDLQLATLSESARFFDLPLVDKLAVDDTKAFGRSHRGYQVIGGQALEEGKGADLKEAFQIGEPKPATHPHVATERMLSGPNQWPTALPDLARFQSTMMAYFWAVQALGHRVMELLLRVLESEMEVGAEARREYARYCEDVVSSIRLLHYPPAGGDEAGDKDAQLGAGAHTDFGGITLLLTDGTPGLQVIHDGIWHAVAPNHEAYIVNIGDAMQKFTAGHFISSTHRVLNMTKNHRYSIPYFYDGNLDVMLRPLVQGPRPEPELTVEAHLRERLDTTRNRAFALS